MGSGTPSIPKVAILFNSEASEEGLIEVDRSLPVFEGYNTIVFSPHPPQIPVDIYATPTSENLFEVLADLAIDRQTDLVIYTVAHGKKGDRQEGTVCFAEGCDHDEFLMLVGGLPYRKRTVIMNQCYGGNWVGEFQNAPRTLFLSATHRNEVNYFGQFSPRFWSKNVPNVDAYPEIEWWERFLYAAQDPYLNSFPIMTMSADYVFEGEPYAEELQEALSLFAPDEDQKMARLHAQMLSPSYIRRRTALLWVHKVLQDGDLSVDEARTSQAYLREMLSTYKNELCGCEEIAETVQQGLRDFLRFEAEVEAEMARLRISR